MSNEQQPIQPDRPVPPPAPQGGWGGEYDGDATAFIQLPGELPGRFHPVADGAHDPLAAPGTGQGWAPPPIEPQPPVTPTATTDPAVPGQWTMPFASGPTDPASEPPEPSEQSEPSNGSPSVAAALGQGAAAALAGSHEARARRPLGDGPARPEPADDRGTYEGTHEGTHGGPTTPSASDADWNAAPAPGATGQWSIPFAAAGSPDDSGEYLAPAAGPTPGPTPAPTPEPAPEPPPPQEPEAPNAPEPVDAPGVSAGDAPARGAGEDEETGTGAGNGSVPEASAVAGEHPHVSYVLRVNGVDRPVTDAWIGESLLYVLRERLGLAGAKDGCSQGECGACSVQVDGRLVASCLVPAATTAGAEVRTVEGLAEDGRPCDVQRALTACGAVQCGFCVPGMAMTLHDLLEGNHSPTELEARQAISGNLCRCSGYRGVLDAVRTVVAEREAAATALAESREAGDRGPEEGGAQVRIPHQGGHAPGGQPPHDHHLPQDGGAQ